MQKVSKNWWRSEALYLASAAGLVVLIVFLSLGIHACIGNEQGNKADGMDESPSATHTQIRATRLAAGSLILCDKAHPFSEDEVEEIEQDCISLSLFAFGASDPPLYALEKPNIRLQKEAAISLAALAQALAA